MNLLEGKLLAEGQRIGIVAGRFNEFITSKLLGGALDAFKRHGGDEANIDLAWVPGAFEIPHTQDETTLVKKKIGDVVNLENDVIAKYVEKLMRPTAPVEPKGGLTLDFLLANGF